MHPVLTLILASSVGWTDPQADDVQRFVAVVASQMIEASPTTAVDAAEPELTVCDIRSFYDAYRPLLAPVAPILIAYDWRLPYHLTKP
jgi:hypothetical protein